MNNKPGIVETLKNLNIVKSLGSLVAVLKYGAMKRLESYLFNRSGRAAEAAQCAGRERSSR